MFAFSAGLLPPRHAAEGLLRATGEILVARGPAGPLVLPQGMQLLLAEERLLPAVSRWVAWRGMPGTATRANRAMPRTQRNASARSRIRYGVPGIIVEARLKVLTREGEVEVL